MRHLLLYNNGETPPSLQQDLGDYAAWFQRVLGGDVTLELHRGFERPRHRVTGYDGLILSGSPRSLAEPEPWMDEAADFVRTAASAGVPVLGVCFGHQLLGHAFGGRVRVNPKGWEVGTIEVELTDEGARDPLFVGLGRRLVVNQSHRDEVYELGEAVRLAGGEHTEVQALAVGTHVRGVQFHPEMNAVVVRGLMTWRRLILTEDWARRDHAHTVEDRLGAACDTPDGERVLRNFVTELVKHA